MRWWFVAALLVVPGAGAVTWDDETDDHRLGYAAHFQDGKPQYQWTSPGEHDWYQNVDITSASIEETPTELVFTIRTASADAQEPPAGPSFNEYVHAFAFTLDDEQHHVAFFPDGFGDEGPVVARASAFEVFGRQRFFQSFPYAPATALDGGGWTGSLPKSGFRDADLVPLREGHVLEDIRVIASDNDIFSGGPPLSCPDVSTQDPTSPGSNLCHWTVEDRIATAGSFEVEQTPPGVGHIFLRFDAPLRYSNGLATTYLYEADLRNLEQIEDTVDLQVGNAPNGWEVRMPTTATFDGAGDTTIPVAVTVPFAHAHGSSHIMTLSAVSRHNTSAIVESGFGVIYADPPQPAGHHDTLRIFGYTFCPEGFNGCETAYMNAGREPIDWGERGRRDIDEVPADWRFYDRSDPTTHTEPAVRHWSVSLYPSLGMGLDFDVSEAGSLEVDLRFEEAWDARIDATLALQRYDDGFYHTTLATGSVEESFTAGTARSVEIPLEVLPSADLVPFDRGQNLVLFINATDTGGLPHDLRTGDAWLVVGDSQMQLPLLDYHPDVDLSGLDFADLSLTRLNSTTKYVNPGKTTLFSFEVGNIGTAPITIDWELDVRDDQTDWLQVTPTASRVPPGGNATVVVRVTVPPEAGEGDTAEILLVGTERKTGSPLYGRMTAAVTDTEEIDDEADQAEHLEREAERSGAAENTPLPLWTAVGMLLLAGRRRR